MAGAVDEALARIPEAERDDCRSLVEQLVAQGATVDEIADAYDEGRLGLLSLEQWLGDEGGRTLDEIAAASGVDPEALVANRRALGLPVERERPAYGPGLEAQARRLAAYRAGGFSEEDVLIFNRVAGRGIAALVATATDLLMDVLAAQEEDPGRRGLLAAQTIVGLLPTLEEGISNVLREHIRQMVRTEAAEQLAVAEPGGAQEVAVAFVDLVGFTSTGQAVSAPELGELAQRLEATAVELSGPDVTVVKVIGDAVMLASREPAKLVEAASRLVAAGGNDGSTLPAMRAGAAFGEAVRRGGDYFGHVVNVASRLTPHAEPGSVVVERRLREATGDAAGWEPAGTRELRGVRGPVEVFTEHAG